MTINGNDTGQENRSFNIVNRSNMNEGANDNSNNE